MVEDKTHRRSVLKTSAAVGMLGIAGCSGGTNAGGESSSGGTTDGGSTTGGSGGEAVNGGHMRVALAQGLASMSPFKGIKIDYLLKETLYDRLTRVDFDFNVKPNLAKDWESNDDASAWTFHLQEDATFANMDGRKVRAEDVKATIEYMQTDNCPSCTRDIPGVDSVEIVDEKTVKLHLARSDVNFPRRCAETGSTFCIAPKPILENNPSRIDETDYGSGPFVLTEWEKDNKMVLEANENYHLTDGDGNQLPYLDKMTAIIQTDEVARNNMLVDGSVDCVNRLPQSSYSQVKERVNIAQRTGGDQFPIILNQTIDEFQSLELRQAMKYAMDRSQMLSVFAGNASLSNHSEFTPVHKYYAEDIAPGNTFGTTAKPKKAKQKLKEAGYGEGLQLPTLYYGDGFAERADLVQLFQQQMKRVGIDFEIQVLEESTWLSDYWAEDGYWYMTDWSTRVNGDTLSRLTVSSKGEWNEARWTNNRYEKALDSALSATTEEARREHLKECQRIMHMEGPWLTTVIPDVMGAYNDTVAEYNLFPTLNKDHLQHCRLAGNQ